MRAVAFFVCLCAAAGPVSAQGWVPMTAPSTNIGPIACSADGTNLVLAAGGWFYQGGVVYVSHDSGATWTAADAPVGLWGAVASSADGRVLLATEGTQGAVYISNDSGATWGLTDLTNGWGQVACSADGTKLFAAGGPIYASVDSGATWAPTGAPALGWGPLACSADGNTVLAGEGANVWVSTNSGAAFWLAYTLAPPYIAAGDQTACASVACSADGARMAAGSYAGYYYPYAGIASSADAGVTWTFSTNAVEFAEFVWMLGYSADGDRMAAAASFGGSVSGVPGSEIFLSGDAGVSWALAPYLPSTSRDRPDMPSPTGLAMSADGCALFAAGMADLAPNFTGAVATFETNPAPSLAVTRSGRVLVLSWVVPSMNFVLEQSADPGGTNWTDVPGTPVLDYSTLQERVTVPAPAGPMFYRLEGPMEPTVVPVDFAYTTNGGAITITGYSGYGLVVTIPSTIDGLPVTAIGDGAFECCSGLAGITIPGSVTQIAEQEFDDCSFLSAISVDTANTAYSSLNGVLFDKKRTTLIQYPPGRAGGYAIPSGVAAIADYAFQYCTELTNLTIADSVASIGDYAFFCCFNLTNFTMPDGVTNIGDSAFNGCDGLTRITIPGSVINIGDQAFMCRYLLAINVDPANTAYSSMDGVLFDKDQTTLLQYPEGRGGSYAIPSGVARIGDYAFEGCAGLTNVSLPDTLTNIGDYAFSACSLSSVTIPNGVTIIGDSAFYESGLSSVTIPDSVTIIGDAAFKGTGLANVTIPGSVRSIGDEAFESCGSLTAATIPNGITSIGDQAFYGCSLTNVRIPASVTNIGGAAFDGCYVLGSVFFMGNAPSAAIVTNFLPGTSWLTYVFSGDTNTVYYLPGTTGWGPTFGGQPTALWNPRMETGDGAFGVRGNEFGFNITGTTNIPIVVEASTDLAGGAWVPLQTGVLTNGLLHFSDPNWTNYPARFYRVGFWSGSPPAPKIASEGREAAVSHQGCPPLRPRAGPWTRRQGTQFGGDAGPPGGGPPRRPRLPERTSAVKPQAGIGKL
ncbi:MAG: leucine-rich repeat protein [Limisphaerales bacterium]